MLDAWIAERMGLPAPLTREALERRQLERLNDTLAYAAAHSSFYREKLPLTHADSLADFARLPFTTPEEVKADGHRMVCVSGAEVERIVTVLETSGSSGRPKRVCFTAAEQEDTVDYFRHGMLEFAAPGDTVLILFPGVSPGSMNQLLGEALRRMGAEPVIFGFPRAADYPAVLECIFARQPRRLVGPPFVLAALAEYSRSRGLAERVAGIVDSVLLAGSFVSETHCRTLTDCWHCRIDEEYGMTETGLAGGVGCRIAGGYHLWESDLYYEVVDPDSGLPVPDGTYGEIVVTTLNRRAMPFVRYRTGDISRFLPGRCPCGSVLRHLERVGDRPCEKKYERMTPVWPD